MTTPTDDEAARLAAMHPPLEDFVPIAPTIKFYNYQKLILTSKTIRKLTEEINAYKPSETEEEHVPRNYKEQSAETLTEDSESQQAEQIEPISSEILETVPPLAPSYEEKLKIDNPEFQEIMKNQKIERLNTAEEFAKQEGILMSNYYDAQIRENLQKNDIVDKRPVSDALRYVSKRISYPSEHSIQRFYKFNFRCDKITKKHKKALTNLHSVQNMHGEYLYQGHLQEVIAFSEFNKIQLPEFSLQKLPSTTSSENQQCLY